MLFLHHISVYPIETRSPATVVCTSDAYGAYKRTLCL